MKVEILNKDEESITYLIKEVFPEFVNAIRRKGYEVLGLAIDSVTFYENSSQIWDEYIAHRIGQIPLKYKPYTFDENTVLQGTIRKEGPGVVTSNDIQGLDVYKDIEILYLNEGERLICDLEVRPGTARQHAKWQIGLITCRPLYTSNVKDKKILQRIKEICPRNTVPGNIECNGCKYCEENIEEVELVPTNDFILYVESWSMGPKEYLLYVINELINDLENLKKVI
jgi:DNA-directed RNA polymerase alpha subunit